MYEERNVFGQAEGESAYKMKSALGKKYCIFQQFLYFLQCQSSGRVCYVRMR